MNDRFGFINIYKIIAQLFISCFLHYRVFILDPLSMDFSGTNRYVTLIMGNNTNYLVELFFVMSGVLFAVAYQARITNDELRFSSFINKRLSKLIPLAVVSTLITFVLRIIYQYRYNDVFFSTYVSLDDLVYSLVLQNSTLLSRRVNPPAWQISKLIICYIIGYVLCKCCKKAGDTVWGIPIVVGMIIQIAPLNVPLLEYHISRAYISFFCGVILVKLIKTFEPYRIYSLMGGFLLTLIPFFLRNNVMNWGLVSTFFIYSGLIIIGYNSRILNLLGNKKITKKLSNVSYDIFMWNSVIMLVFLFLWHEFNIRVDTYLFLVFEIFIHILFGYASNCIREKIRNIVSSTEK